MDPVTHMGPELDALLRRLIEVDASKWQALAELGLPAVGAPAKRRKEGGAR